MKFRIQSLQLNYAGTWSPTWQLHIFFDNYSTLKNQLVKNETKEIISSKPSVITLPTKIAKVIREIPDELPPFSNFCQFFSVRWDKELLYHEFDSISNNFDSIVFAVTYGNCLYLVCYMELANLTRLTTNNSTNRLYANKLFSQDDLFSNICLGWYYLIYLLIVVRCFHISIL